MFSLLCDAIPELLLNFFRWWTAERGLLAVAIISAVIALRTYRQNSIIERNANRPMMCAEVLRPTFVKDDLKMQISNKGKSVAKKVSFTFDPELPSPTLDELRERYSGNVNSVPIEAVKAIFCDTTFDTWVPGFETEATLWILPNNFDLLSDDLTSAEGVPAQQTVVIRYEDDLGRVFEDSFVLDFRAYMGVEFVTKSDDGTKREIQNIREELSTLNVILAELHEPIVHALAPQRKTK